tara:strand:- start:1061 stop:1720 length:660 start_codon:yes stop_codon:yes gene_type:complete
MGLLDALTSAYAKAEGLLMESPKAGLLTAERTSSVPDYATSKRARGPVVVESAIKRIEKMLGPKVMTADAKELMDITANVESWRGLYPKTFDKQVLGPRRSVGHGGLWQVTSKNIKDTVKEASRRNENAGINKVLDKLTKLGFDFRKLATEEDTVIEDFLEKPLNSGLAARLAYLVNNNPIPSSTIGKIRYYHDVFAPQTRTIKKPENYLRGLGLIGSF